MKKNKQDLNHIQSQDLSVLAEAVHSQPNLRVGIERAEEIKAERELTEREKREQRVGERESSGRTRYPVFAISQIRERARLCFILPGIYF